MQQPPTVLIVDDIPTNVQVLAETLSAVYRIKVAGNGADALAIAQREPRPDLIFLDVMMPEMDGYEVCKRLKADPQTRDIPVIFITAKGETKDEMHGLELGAVDYITKPVVPSIVLARARTHLALEQAKQQLEQHVATLQHEKDVVEDIVSRIRSAAPFDERHVRYFLSSVERTAGDMLFSAYRPDGCQHVLVCDFSGHGLPAAIGGPMVSYMFYHLTAEGLALDKMLAEMNTTLQRHLPIQLYMAAAAVEISANRQSAKFWNHGLPPALVLHQGQVLQRIPSTDLPLGIVAPIEIPPDGKRIDLRAGSFIYLYSDGISEAPSPDGEAFGLERLEASLASISQSRAELAQINSILAQYHGGADFPDDATLMEIAV